MQRPPQTSWGVGRGTPLGVAKAGPTPQVAADKKRAKYRRGPAFARRRGNSPTQPNAAVQGRCLGGAVYVCAAAGLRHATAHNAFPKTVSSFLGAALPCAGEDDVGDWVGDWGRATSDEIPPFLLFRGRQEKRRNFSGAGRASGRMAPRCTTEPRQ